MNSQQSTTSEIAIALSFLPVSVSLCAPAGPSQHATREKVARGPCEHAVEMEQDAKSPRATAIADRKLASVVGNRMQCLLPALLPAGRNRQLLLPALETLVDAVSRATAGDEAAVVARLDESGALGAIVELCGSTLASDDDVQSLCLVFLSNLGWMGAHEVLVSLGALGLPVRVLLTAPSKAPLVARQAAAIALGNLITAPRAAMWIPQDAYSQLRVELEALLDSELTYYSASTTLKTLGKAARIPLLSPATHEKLHTARRNALQSSLERAHEVGAGRGRAAPRRREP